MQHFCKSEYVLSGYILLNFSDDLSTKGYKLYHFFLHRRCAFIKQHSEKTCRDDIALLVARFTAVNTIVLTKANRVKMHLLIFSEIYLELCIHIEHGLVILVLFIY